MPRLKLNFKGKFLREYSLDTGVPLTIGRRTGNTIVIRDPTVSREHAKVEFLDGHYVLTDLKSQNGTYVNRAPVTTHLLEHGDVLMIGRHHLVFFWSEVELQPEIRMDTARETPPRAAEAGSQPAEIIQAESGISSQGMENIGVLSFLAGGTGSIRLTKRSIAVGRGPACDIVVHGRLIGDIAFTIDRGPTGYSMTYVGGKSVAKVDGQPVKQSVRLKEFDIIEIGSTKLQFFSVLRMKERP